MDTQRASITYSTEIFPALRRILAKEGIEAVGSSRIYSLEAQLGNEKDVEQTKRLVNTRVKEHLKEASGATYPLLQYKAT